MLPLSRSMKHSDWACWGPGDSRNFGMLDRSSLEGEGCLVLCLFCCRRLAVLVLQSQPPQWPLFLHHLWGRELWPHLLQADSFQ